MKGGQLKLIERLVHPGLRALMQLSPIFVCIIVLLPNVALAQPTGPNIAFNLKTVPNVVNLTRVEADARVKAAGLTPAPTLANGEDGTKLIVVTQAPLANTSERAGEPVLMTTKIASPPKVITPTPVVTVPNLVGFSASQAVAILTGVGLHVGRVAAIKGGLGPATVSSSSPPAGAAVAQGSSVSYTLASNLRPVPRVTDLNSPVAIQVLRRAGFEPRPYRAGPVGLIVQSEAPAAGALAPAGAVITLAIGAQPPNRLDIIWKSGLVVVVLGAAGLAIRKLIVRPHPIPGVSVHMAPPQVFLRACAPSDAPSVVMKWSTRVDRPRSSLARSEDRHD